MTAPAELPLKGIRIVAVEQYGAGPYGSMYLAQLGAEVLKIEPPRGGDVSRSTGPYFLGEGDSEFFQTFNQNKKSLALDLKAPQGVEVLHRLAARADAVSNNLRGDQPARLGLDYAALGKVNPRIVCAHLSAYGRDTDRAGWPGYDYLMQAETGFMHLTGEPDGPPTRFGLSMVDFMTGVICSSGLLAALLGVARGGCGCDLDVSLFDTALHQLSYPATWYLNEGAVTGRLPRSAHPSAVPCQLYATADGWLFIAAIQPKFWDALLAALGREDLAQDARFASAKARSQHRDELAEILDRELAAQTGQHWMEKLAGKVPAAPVRNLAEALDSPWVQSQGAVQKIPHPRRGELRVLSNPIRINGAVLDGRPGSALGADSQQTLAEIGYSAEEIRELVSAGVVATGRQSRD